MLHRVTRPDRPEIEVCLSSLQCAAIIRALLDNAPGMSAFHRLLFPPTARLFTCVGGRPRYTTRDVWNQAQDTLPEHAARFFIFSSPFPPGFKHPLTALCLNLFQKGVCFALKTSDGSLFKSVSGSAGWKVNPFPWADDRDTLYMFTSSPALTGLYMFTPSLV